MDAITISLIAGIVVSSLSSILYTFRATIKKSSCCFGALDIQTNSQIPQQPQPQIEFRQGITPNYNNTQTKTFNTVMC